MFLITLLLIVVAVAAFIYERTLKPKNFPPGPKFNPLTGSTPAIRALAKEHGGIHKAVHKLSQMYDSNVIGLKYGQALMICVTDDRAHKEILTRDEFQSRPTSFFSTLRTLGTNKGITFANGELWTTQRRFLLRQLRDVGFGKEKMDAMVGDELDNIIQQIGATETPTISRTFATSVLNVIWAMIAGERLGNDNAKLENLLDLIGKRAKLFDMTGGWLNALPWLRFVAPKASGYELITRLNAEMQQLFMGVIDEHKRTWYAGRNDDVIYDFLTEMNEAKDASFTDDQLVMICVDMFIGGATTTSTSLEFIFMCMLLYPDVQKKVHECIDKVYLNCAMPHYKDRHLLPYVEAVIFETLRRYLVAPITGPRVAARHCKVESYDIPEGATIMMNNYSLNHDPKLWEDPENFRPERFLDADGKITLPNYFYPFNIGKRKCPADVLARNCLFTFFAGVMKTYEITLHDKSQKLTGIEIPGITISPEPFKACFRKRHS